MKRNNNMSVRQIFIGMGKIQVFCAVMFLLAADSSAAELTVTSNADSGAGSLRQAIADATSDDTIVFDGSLDGSVITLTSGQLDLDKSLTILGPGPDRLVIDGNTTSRIFNMQQSGNDNYWISISGLTISNGLASAGGGIRSSVNDWWVIFRLTVSNCVVTANSSTGVGGGIYASRHTILTLVDSDVSENQAGDNGGGLWTGFTALIERCLFSTNTTASSGGGIFVNQHEKAVIRNCTITGNSSTYTGWNTGMFGGGGIFCNVPTVDILNTTISGNYARRGGGLRVNNSGSRVVLNSTLISGNSDNDGFPDIYGTYIGLTNCLVTVTNNVTLPGENNIFDQPALLEDLADNGGLTRTHALSPNSPAIDAGNNPAGLTTDQRGFGFPRESGDGVDIGAFELTSSPKGTVLIIK